jgi:hypothetical protein
MVFPARYPKVPGWVIDILWWGGIALSLGSAAYLIADLAISLGMQRSHILMVGIAGAFLFLLITFFAASIRPSAPEPGTVAGITAVPVRLVLRFGVSLEQAEPGTYQAVTAVADNPENIETWIANPGVPFIYNKLGGERLNINSTLFVAFKQPTKIAYYDIKVIGPNNFTAGKMASGSSFLILTLKGDPEGMLLDIRGVP